MKSWTTKTESTS